MMTQINMYKLLRFLTLLQLMISIEPVSSIGCFKCVSVGKDNPSCEDPFHNNMTRGEVTLELPCMGGRKGRDGLFPASDCIKVTGSYDDTGESMMIRGCAVDSGTLTTDTEIIRMSHCGAFYFNERYVRGCVQSCSDVDGCNGSLMKSLSINLFGLILIVLLQ